MTNEYEIDGNILMILNEIRNSKADLKNNIVNINTKLEDQGAEIATLQEHIKNILELLARIDKIEKTMETYASKTSKSVVNVGFDEKGVNKKQKVVIYKEGRACGSEEQSGDDAVKNEKSRLKNKEDVLEYSKKIVGIFPINEEDIKKNMFKEEIVDNTVKLRTVEEYLHKELGFKLEQIVVFGVTNVKKSWKDKTFYVHMKNEHGSS